MSVAVVVAILFGGASCGEGSGPSVPSATLGTATTAASSTTNRPESRGTATTQDTPVFRAVEDAYLRSWSVYARAARRLSSDGLDQTYSGPALEVVVAEVQRLRRNNTPVHIAVTHDYMIEVGSDGTAIVIDTYINHSVMLDGETGQPVEADPNETVSEVYSMALENRSWKVVGLQRS
jgi:hypothetical protein